MLGHENVVGDVHVRLSHSTAKVDQSPKPSLELDDLFLGFLVPGVICGLDTKLRSAIMWFLLNTEIQQNPQGLRGRRRPRTVNNKHNNNTKQQSGSLMESSSSKGQSVTAARLDVGVDCETNSGMRDGLAKIG